MRPASYLLQGDARAIPLKSGSIQCVVTSPPYWGLRDYGVAEQIGLEPTPELYVAHLVEVFREVKRVLRSDGTVWCNLGDSYCGYHGNSRTGEGPAPSDKPGYRENMRPSHVGMSGLKNKDLVGIPWRVAFALQADGWWLRSDVIWAKPNPMPESITDRPTKAHEYLFLLTKRASYFYDPIAIQEPCSWGDGQRVVNVDTPKNRLLGLQPTREYGHKLDGGRNRRTVWTIATQPYPEAHFATFPEALVEPCVLAGSRPGDRVLDPFAGSGTTVAVAERLGRVGIGLELKAEYLRLAKRRTVQAGLL